MPTRALHPYIFPFVMYSIMFFANPGFAQPKFIRDSRKCGEFCYFRICRLNATIEEFQIRPVASYTIFGNPQEPESPSICLPGSERTFDVVDVIGEARVFDHDTRSFIPISLWRPFGLSHPFPPDIIGVYKVLHYPRSGFALTKGVVGNQWSYLHDRCMILPIHRYREVSKLGLRRVSTEMEANACVAFKITAPELRFHLQWDTGDDLDILVEQPDGDVIDYNNTYTESGRLPLDENNGLCLAKLPGGKENVLYLPDNGRQSGQYTVEAFINQKCSSRNTTWTLRIYFKGVEKMRTSGIITEEPEAGELRSLGKLCIDLPE